MFHRLYAKSPGDKRYSPMDWKAGHQVINLMFATLFSPEETQRLEAELPKLHKENPGWKFMIRKAS